MSLIICHENTLTTKMSRTSMPPHHFRYMKYHAMDIRRDYDCLHMLWFTNGHKILFPNLMPANSKFLDLLTILVTKMQCIKLSNKLKHK